MYRFGAEKLLLENPLLAWFRPRVFRAGLEIALVLLLSLQTARLVWILIAPIGPFEAPGPAAPRAKDDLAILKRFNPFIPKNATVLADEDAAGSDRGLSLFGVRSDGSGGGSAIIASNGAPQMVYAAGEEIAPGIVLKTVASDHVLLTRGSRITRLALAPPSVARGSGAAAIPSYLLPARSTPPAEARAAAVAIDPKKLIAEAGFLPRTVDGRVTGYTLLPRGGGETLRLAGLAAGDVLVALNGNRITPERYSEIEQELAGAPEVQLTVERGSQTRTITLQTGR